MHYSFEGKNALVTGSSKGIGRAVAIGLARGGANVTINCSSSRSAAEEVQREIEKLGRKAIIVACDVSDQVSSRQSASDVVVVYRQYFGIHTR